jgi:hypothetical protein
MKDPVIEGDAYCSPSSALLPSISTALIGIQLAIYLPSLART